MSLKCNKDAPVFNSYGSISSAAHHTEHSVYILYYDLKCLPYLGKINALNFFDVQINACKAIKRIF